MEVDELRGVQDPPRNSGVGGIRKDSSCCRLHKRHCGSLLQSTDSCVLLPLLLQTLCLFLFSLLPLLLLDLRPLPLVQRVPQQTVGRTRRFGNRDVRVQKVQLSVGSLLDRFFLREACRQRQKVSQRPCGKQVGFLLALPPIVVPQLGRPVSSRRPGLCQLVSSRFPHFLPPRIFWGLSSRRFFLSAPSDRIRSQQTHTRFFFIFDIL
mmetsp:Transcript_37063/g.72915  ORF Transcript_37063/g.72915 Transcript_37063/m.72915 type:complete len:208 (-) Transcript_37063:504-1127(-)